MNLESYGRSIEDVTITFSLRASPYVRWEAIVDVDKMRMLTFRLERDNAWYCVASAPSGWYAGMAMVDTCKREVERRWNKRLGEMITQ